MKKFLCAIAAVCVAISMVGCAKAHELPDPTGAVEEYYKNSVKNINSDLWVGMLEEEYNNISEAVSEVPEAKEAFDAYIAAYLEDMEVEVSGQEEQEINAEEKTARVMVSIDCVDMDKLQEGIEAAIKEKIEEITLSGEMPSEAEIFIYTFEAGTELIKRGDAARTSGNQVVELSYDDAGGQWTVTNGETIARSFLG
jgi:seryl-tRNA synthetase